MRGGWYGFLRTKTQVLWPHELFSAIYNFHPTAFVRFILGGGQEVVRNFGEGCRPGEDCGPELGGINGVFLLVYMAMGWQSPTFEVLGRRCWTH